MSTNFEKEYGVFTWIYYAGSFQNGYEEKWQKDGVVVDIFSSQVANGKHTLAVWIEGKPYFCSYQFTGNIEKPESKSKILILTIVHSILVKPNEK